MSRILYIQYTNPAGYPPLQHSSRLFAEAGWSVLFLGTGASGASTLEFPPYPGISVRRLPFQKPGWRQKLHYLKFCLWVLWTALIWRPDWIYASDFFSCPPAALLMFLPRLRVVYHEHDTPAAPTGPNAFLNFLGRARHYVARRAELCILPNARRLARFAEESGPLRHSACIWNCPGLYEITEAPDTLPQPPLWILYHGTIVPERISPLVLDALALLPQTVHLRVVGYETVGAPGYVGQLRRKAESLGLGSRVEFLKPVSRKDLFAYTLQSDIGLALIPLHSADQNFEAMTGASNKVFDYMACGLPVIVSDLPEWREMFVAPGYGLACDPDDPASLAKAILCLVENPAQMRKMGQAARRRILDEWNYDHLFAPVLQYLTT